MFKSLISGCMLIYYKNTKAGHSINHEKIVRAMARLKKVGAQGSKYQGYLNRGTSEQEN